jgi:hypothetical protein
MALGSQKQKVSATVLGMPERLDYTFFIQLTCKTVKILVVQNVFPQNLEGRLGCSRSFSQL